MTNFTNPNRPVEHIKLGRIEVAIWRNFPRGEYPTFSVTVQRHYKVDETGEWKTSNSFDKNDLLLLAKTVDLAHSRILELQQEQFKASQSAEAAAEDPTAEIGDESARYAAQQASGTER